MRRLLWALALLIAAAALFFAGYFVALPPSESRPCVNALRDFDSAFVQQCRDALDRADPTGG